MTGNLLSLRPLTEADFDELYQVASDPLIWDQHPFPRYEISAFKEYFTDALNSKTAFLVFDKSSSQLIGTSRYYGVQNRQAYIGYTFLARSHWGGKFNRELKTLMLNHAFTFADVVFFDVGENNLRSRRAVEKIGAQFVKLQTLKNKPYALYQITEPEFQKSLGT